MELTIEIKKIFVDGIEVGKNLAGYRIKDGEYVYVDMATRQAYIVPKDPHLN